MINKMRYIIEERASFYSCDVDTFYTNGVTVLNVDSLQGKSRFTIATYLKHSFLRTDPLMKNPLEGLPNIEEKSPKDIVFFLKDMQKTKGVQLRKTYCYFYYLEDKRVDIETSLDIRRITDGNNEKLMDFLRELTEEELDLADININQLDPVIFGGFVDGKMVGYVSHRYPQGSSKICDIGIVVDSSYRGKGFGKALLSHEVNWCVQSGVVPMYVVLDNNTKSKALVQSMGFELIGEVYST